MVNKDDKNQKISEDVMIVIVHNDFIGQCDGAINSLADKQDKRYVATLIHAIRHSNYLDFVYAAIRGVEKLTGLSFTALGINEVLDWWEVNKSDKSYHCAFEHYYEADMLPNESADDCAWRKAEYLMEWIREKPNQYYSASLLPPIILFAKVDAEKAKKRKEMLEFVFEYWGKENPRANDWYVFKTLYLACFDTNAIFDFVNERLMDHPQFEEELKRWHSFFIPQFFELPNINWPSRQNSDNGQGEKRNDEGN